MSFDGLKKVAQQSQTQASFVLIKTLHPPPIPTHHHHWWIKGCCWTRLIVSLRPRALHALEKVILHRATFWRPAMFMAWTPGQSSDPQNSTALRYDDQAAKATAGLPGGAEQHLLLTNESPSFSEYLYLFLHVFYYINKTAKKKAGALFINTACTLHAPPMPFHFKKEHARHLRNASPKKRRGALATDPRYRDVLSEVIWQGYFMLEVSQLSIKTIVYFICVRCRCMSIMY